MLFFVFLYNVNAQNNYKKHAMKNLFFPLLLFTFWYIDTMNETGKTWLLYNTDTNSIIAYYHCNRESTFVTKNLSDSRITAYRLYEDFEKNKISRIVAYPCVTRFLKNQIEKFEANLPKEKKH